MNIVGALEGAVTGFLQGGEVGAVAGGLAGALGPEQSSAATPPTASPLAALAPFGGDGVDLSGLLQGGGLQGLLPVAGGGSADPSSALGASSLGADSDDALGSLLA